jgi:hypothetical protein
MMTSSVTYTLSFNQTWAMKVIFLFATVLRDSGTALKRRDPIISWGKVEFQY